MTHRLVVSPEAHRQLNALPEKVALAVIAFLDVIAERPLTVGGRLTLPPFEGLFSARRGAYRIVYAIDGDLVTVRRIDHRSTAYRT